MSPEPTLRFIDDTMQAMTWRPALWGALCGVELQVLRLLEVRAVLLGREPKTTGSITAAYAAFLRRKYPSSAPTSLWTRVESSGGTESDFCALLREFIDEQRRGQDGDRT